ncbi:MAG: DUF4157 domain-containing protein [Kofleriaceae bacterium]
MTREREQGSDHDERHRRDDRGGAHGIPGKHALTDGLTGRTGVFDSGLAGPLMRKATRDDNGVAPDAESAVATAASSSGSSLPVTLQRKFESSLGTDLSDVRVHTGAESQAAASAVGAKAYTVGQDIHFGAGHYDPSSGGGEHLIAHEVAHTVQQRGASPSRQNKLAISTPHDAAEHEADRAADAMVSGTPATVSTAGGTLARKGLVPEQPKKSAEAGKGSVNLTEEYPEVTLSPKLFGQEFSITGSANGDLKGETGLSGALDFDAFKIEHQIPFQIPGAPFGVRVAVVASLDASLSGNIKAVGAQKTFPGPVENEGKRGWEVGLTGGGAVTVSVKGRAELTPYFGAGFMHVHGGGYVELSGSVQAKIGVGGKISIFPNGTSMGTGTAELLHELKVTASGGITIGYHALVAEGKLYEAELASWDFFSKKFGIKSTWDASGGGERTVETTNTKPEFKMPPFSKPKLVADKGIAAKAKAAAEKAAPKQSVAPEEKTQTTQCDAETSCEENPS